MVYGCAAINLFFRYQHIRSRSRFSSDLIFLSSTNTRMKHKQDICVEKKNQLEVAVVLLYL